VFLVQPTPVSPTAIRFGLFEADLSASELRKRGRKIPLQDQPFRVLTLLLARAGELVTREELQRALWPTDTFGDFDEGLNKAIQKLRQALDDSSDNPRFIETLPRKGYRFIAPVDRTAGEASAAQGQSTPVDSNAVSSLAVRPVKRRNTAVIAWVLFGVVSVALLILAGVYFRVLRPGSRPTMKTVPLTSYPGHQGDPAISPDGKQVAFAWDGEKGGNFDIYVKLVDAGTPLRLTSSPADEYAPAWSADARYIAFCRDVSDHVEILMIPALGGVERKLGESAGCGLSWSPDGKYLVF
jgi:DNA-binding winged helix-turn-helix (wHTH) protein